MQAQVAAAGKRQITEIREQQQKDKDTQQSFKTQHTTTLHTRIST